MQNRDPRNTIENPEYFRQIPWCASFVDDPSYEIVPGITQKIGARPGTNKLLSKTLRSPEAIEATVALRRRLRTDVEGKPQIIVLLAIGADLDGHESTLHGGMAGVFLDEIAGLVLDMYDVRYVASNTQFLTARLDIVYRRPVRTPQVLLGCADLVDEGERKVRVSVDLKDKEGVVLCHGDATFVKVKGGPTL